MALAQRKSHIFTHGERIKKCAVLENHGDFLAYVFKLRLVVIRDVLKGHDHTAFIRLEEAHDVMQGDRFAHAAAPENAERFTGIHLEAHILKHAMVAERFVNVPELDVRLVAFRVWVMLLVAHVSRPEKRRRARSMSSGVFRFSSISALKANRRSSASLITSVWPRGKSGVIL